MLYDDSDAPELHVPHSIEGHGIPYTDPLVGGEIHIAPIVISHTEVNIFKMSVF